MAMVCFTCFPSVGSSTLSDVQCSRLWLLVSLSRLTGVVWNGACREASGRGRYVPAPTGEGRRTTDTERRDGLPTRGLEGPVPIPVSSRVSTEPCADSGTGHLFRSPSRSGTGHFFSVGSRSNLLTVFSLSVPFTGRWMSDVDGNRWRVFALVCEQTLIKISSC